VHGGLGHGGGGESAVEPRYRALSVQTVPRLVRHLLTEGVRVTKIAVGATHCACIDNSLRGGRLWTWGCGRVGYGHLRQGRRGVAPSNMRRLTRHVWHRVLL
jgi:alpha-tubulin suppressor-like RCC1 family protein